MLSIQHIMCGALSMDRSRFENQAAALVFPDAIRAYSGQRQYSHFEKAPDGTDVSWWSFPTDMKHVSKESVQKSLQEHAHLVADIPPCVVGEETDVDAFYQHNQNLSPDMFQGIEMHLRQDCELDAFVREKIDCSDRYADRFVMDGQVYDGKGVRQLIGRMEQYGIYYLAHELYEQKGIVANQDWLNSYVKPLLDEAYPQDLADKTFSFMKIAAPYATYITQRDWSHLSEVPDGLTMEDYHNFYEDVARAMLQPSAKPERELPTVSCMFDTESELSL